MVQLTVDTRKYLLATSTKHLYDPTWQRRISSYPLHSNLPSTYLATNQLRLIAGGGALNRVKLNRSSCSTNTLAKNEKLRHNQACRVGFRECLFLFSFRKPTDKSTIHIVCKMAKTRMVNYNVASYETSNRMGRRLGNWS